MQAHPLHEQFQMEQIPFQDAFVNIQSQQQQPRSTFTTSFAPEKLNKPLMKDDHMEHVPLNDWVNFQNLEKQ